MMSTTGKTLWPLSRHSRTAWQDDPRRTASAALMRLRFRWTDSGAVARASRDFKKGDVDEGGGAFDADDDVVFLPLRR